MLLLNSVLILLPIAIIPVGLILGRIAKLNYIKDYVSKIPNNSKIKKPIYQRFLGYNLQDIKDRYQAMDILSRQLTLKYIKRFDFLFIVFYTCVFFLALYTGFDKLDSLSQIDPQKESGALDSVKRWLIDYKYSFYFLIGSVALADIIENIFHSYFFTKIEQLKNWHVKIASIATQIKLFGFVLVFICWTTILVIIALSYTKLLA